MSLFSSLKNIFGIGVMLIAAPLFIAILKEEYGGFFNPYSKVGELFINGPISASRPYIKHLNTLFKDTTIKGIILYIECKDGLPGSAQLIHQEIEYLKKEYPKPIITLVENVCTSEGYLIASATDTIIAPASAIIGGIKPTLESLVTVFTPVEKAAQDDKPIQNIATQEENSSYHKILNESIHIEEISSYQKVFDDIYHHSITAIALKRKLSLNDHELWGKGILFTGSQALKLHLIDQIGCSADAQAILKEKALIDGDVLWVNPSHKRSIIF